MKQLTAIFSLSLGSAFMMTIPATAETWQARNINIVENAPQICAGFEDR
jgi:hypothetical protein